MAVQFDDQGLRLIGLGERHIDFYDDDGDLRASIYLDANGNLNIGGIQLSTSDGGEGSTVDLASVPFLAIAANDLLQNERVFVAGDGLQATDEGGGNNYTVRLGTPGTLSAQSAAAVTASSHTHPITASSNPGANEFILKSTAAGALTLQQLNVDNIRLDGNTLSAQSGDLTLTAAGGDVVLPSAINIGANNYVSQLTGWRIDYDGDADFRSMYADELHVKAFIADIEQALAGGQIISKSVAIVSRDFVVPYEGAITFAYTVGDAFDVAGDQTGNISPGEQFVISGSTGNDGTWTVASATYSAGTDRTTIFVTGDVTSGVADGTIQFLRFLYVEDLPDFENVAAFTAADWVRMRVIDRSGGGLVVADVWGTVAAYSDQAGGEQRWAFRCRDQGDVAGSTVYAGAIVLDFGASGDGWHEITALDSDGPYAQIVTWETDPTNSANYTLRSRLGNLDGVTDADFPSIGGWGLYSTNAFLKGEVWAASGDVTIDGDGITIASGTLDRNRIIWDDGGTPEVSIGTLVDGRMILDALEAGAVLQAAGNIEINPFALVTIDGGLVVDDDLFAGPGTLNVISSTSRVGVGTATPDYRVDAQASVADYLMRIFNDGNNNNRHGLIIQAGADVNPSHVAIRFEDGDRNGIGAIVGTGAGGVSYNVTSDERTKHDIEPVRGAMAKVLTLQPITYRGRGAPRNGAKRPGLVAQAVQSVLPELVTEIDGLLTLDYMGVIPYLIGAIQDLHTRLEALEAG